MVKVLVTGSSGFIGSSLLFRLISLGFDAIGWSRIGNGKFTTNVNMDNLVDIEKHLLEFKPDIVVHCAGAADVGISVVKPENDFMGNVILTHNLLFTLHRIGLDHIKFIFLSSAGVYGNPISLPIAEDFPLNPLSPYALHKVMCEDICKFFAKNYGMDVKIARIFSAYGQGLKKQIFWDLYKKICSDKEIMMYGTGDESRDYIYIDDVIQSILLLITKQSSEMVFNVANGEEVTIREAAERFICTFRADKKRLKFIGQVREGDPLNWKADISRIKKIGYKKTVDMQTGLQYYHDWIDKIAEG